MKFYLAPTKHMDRVVRSMKWYQKETLKYLGVIAKLVAWWLPTRMKNNGENITKSVLGDAHQSRGNALEQSVETALLGRFPSVRA